jgi:hypothetical protein
MTPLFLWFNAITILDALSLTEGTLIKDDRQLFLTNLCHFLGEFTNFPLSASA